MSLQNRYTDAYLVAQTVNGTGQTIKFVGFVVAGLVIVGGLVTGNNMGGAFGFAGLFLGILIALPFYALGVLVSAQGQILKATLDTAVNTSPIFSQDEIRQILTGLSLPVPATADLPSPSNSSPLPQSTAQRSCPHCGRALPPGVSRCRWCMKKV